MKASGLCQWLVGLLFLIGLTVANAAIGVRSTSSAPLYSGSSTSYLSTITFSVPAGTTTGDVMVAAITNTGSGTMASTPSGWTLIRSVTLASGKGTLAAYYHAVKAGDPSSYTWTVPNTSSDCVVGVITFTGVDTNTPVDVSNSQPNPSSLLQAAPTITPSASTDFLLTIHSFASSPYSSSGTYSGSWAPPSGMTERVDARSRGSSTSSGTSLSMNTLQLSTTSATLAKTATAAGRSDVGAGISVALRASSSFDHLEIDYPSNALSSCTNTPVVVYACASSDCSTKYTGGVSGITLTPGGGVISISSGVASVNANVIQAVGSGTLGTSGTAGTTTCKNLATGSFTCNVTFSSTSLTVTIPNFVSGKSVTAPAVACALPNGLNNVSFYTGYSDPTTGTKQVSIAPYSGGACGTYQAISTNSASPTTIGLNFSSNASNICITYPDVGTVKLVSTLGVTSTNSFFTSVPDHFGITNINCVSGCKVTANPAATSASGSAFMKVGSPFSMTVTAYNFANVVTPNFGKETSPEKVKLTPTAAMSDLSGAVTGNLSCNTPSTTCANGVGIAVLGGAGAFTAGVATDNFTYGEVGNMNVTPSLYDPDGLGYLSIGNSLLDANGTSSGSVGRFYPDHFEVSQDASNPIVTQADLSSVSTTSGATTAPATVINVTSSTGFVSGAKVRVVGAGAGGNAMTARIMAITSTTLTLDTATGSDLVGGEAVVQEWGTYMGETFNAKFALNSVDLAGNTLQNYRGAYAKLSISSTSNPFGFAAVNGGTNLTSRLDTSTAASGTFGSTGASIVAPIKFSRGVSADGPYAALVLAIAPSDSDGVVLGGGSSYDTSVGGVVNHTSIMDPLVQASTEVRYGRIRISNAYGSELLPLLVPIALQYWNGTSYVNNTDDVATGLMATNISLSSALGSLSAASGTNVSGTCTGSLATGITLTGGAGKFCLAPKPGVAGNVNLSSSSPSYLPSNTATATFGVYKSPLIYRRENY